MDLEISEIKQHIFSIRGQRVMLDNNLAELYQVGTKGLKQAVRRSKKKFPDDFVFELSEIELKSLGFAFPTTSSSIKKNHGGTRYSPFAFSEHGIAMLSSVLNTDRAIEVNIAIMRAFVE